MDNQTKTILTLIAPSHHEMAMGASRQIGFTNTDYQSAFKDLAIGKDVEGKVIAASFFCYDITLDDLEKKVKILNNKKEWKIWKDALYTEIAKSLPLYSQRTDLDSCIDHFFSFHGVEPVGINKSDLYSLYFINLLSAEEIVTAGDRYDDGVNQ